MYTADQPTFLPAPARDMFGRRATMMAGIGDRDAGTLWAYGATLTAVIMPTRIVTGTISAAETGIAAVTGTGIVTGTEIGTGTGTATDTGIMTAVS